MNIFATPCIYIAIVKFCLKGAVILSLEKDGTLKVDAIEKPDKSLSIEDKHKPQLIEIAV